MTGSEPKLTTGHVLILDDDQSIRRVLVREMEESGFTVSEAENGDQGMALLGEVDIEAVLLDIKLPGKSGVEILPEIKAQWPEVEVVMLTGHGDVDNAVACMRDGAFDFLQKPCHLGEVEAALSKAIEKRRLAESNRSLMSHLSGDSVEESDRGSVSKSPAMQELFSIIYRIAPTEVSVIVTGESGTGKEVAAREIVARSKRANEAFLTINCGALTPSLLESELFGHEKGAFTGAMERRLGFFELANGGTIFLDEIAEMPPEMQTKLLRLLQFGEFIRVGSSKPLVTDVRIIAATNRDLEEEIAKGSFREDLYYRLNTVELHIPPLRERLDDLPDLCAILLGKSQDEVGQEVRVSPEALACLTQHSWPGNIRELDNALRAAAIMTSDGVIRAAHLPQHLRRESSGPSSGTARELTIDEVERQHILAVLERCGGNKAETARQLGITKKTLYSKLTLYGRHSRGD